MTGIEIFISRYKSSAFYSFSLVIEDHLSGFEGDLEKVPVTVLLCCLEILATKAVITLECWWSLIPSQP